ncbi:unnamed protein product [Linum trigynum]|uniref:Uncharacterized protein n=1 Tax=Linum trigynum TaxID=586398 RepID=A0AAV2CT62_9ROSI
MSPEKKNRRHRQESDTHSCSVRRRHRRRRRRRNAALAALGLFLCRRGPAARRRTFRVAAVAGAPSPCSSRCLLNLGVAALFLASALGG